jgi:hypothetical protein
MKRRGRQIPSWLVGFLVCVTFLGRLSPAAGGESPNLFANPSFELGREGWQLDKAGKTVCRFTVDEKDAADGQTSALIDVGFVDDWGVQFGQHFAAGQKGKTYTLAALAKSTKGPVEVGLQIERSASPWDRAASGKFKLTAEWQELHVTFKVEKDFPQGWFAYLSCTQPNVQFRADMFRLYEGAYVPHKELSQQAAAAVAVRLFDSGKASPVALSGEALTKRAGWTEIAEDQLAHKFAGDAVILNDKVALVLRRGATGAELYSLGPRAPAMRALLAPVAGTNTAAVASCTILENNPGAVAVEVAFTRPRNPLLSLRYELKLGQPVIQTENHRGATGLRVDAPCRFVVMPDFFADDIVADAAELPVAEAELPSDNIVLQLLPDRAAMLMTVVKMSDEDIRIALAGDGEDREIRRSEIRYGKDGKIWVGVLAHPAIWHVKEVTSAEAGQIVRLDWAAPFPAQWRTDWRREEGLTESWEMLNERPDGQFARYGLYGGPETIPADRKRWTTVLGEFKYPCWLDQAGQGWLQPLKRPALRLRGPAVIYPINRAPATALDEFTVVDILRNTLGIGPCEYVLDVEGQQSQYKGRATCAVRDALNPIYAQDLQSKRRVEIEKILQDLMVFIRHIRGRIESYVAFGNDTLQYLAEQKKAHPELADRLAELETIARSIDDRFDARRNAIKTPDDAAALVEEFRKTVLDYEGDDALAKCKQFTEAWVMIGGNQDELAGECRWAAKMLRQRAGLLMAADPRLADIAREIRRRSQLVLRNPAAHEGARH